MTQQHLIDLRIHVYDLWEYYITNIFVIRDLFYEVNFGPRTDDLDRVLHEIAMTFWGQWQDIPPYPEASIRSQDWKENFISDFLSRRPYDIPDCVVSMPAVPSIINDFIDELESIHLTFSNIGDGRMGMEKYDKQKKTVLEKIDVLIKNFQDLCKEAVVMENFTYTTSYRVFEMRYNELRNCIDFLSAILENTNTEKRVYRKLHADNVDRIKDMWLVFSTIGYACRSYKTRNGFSIEVPEHCWYQHMKEKIGILEHSSERAFDTFDNLLNVLIYTYDIPRQLKHSKTFIYERVLDPGNMRYIYQENTEWMDILFHWGSLWTQQHDIVHKELKELKESYEDILSDLCQKTTGSETFLMKLKHNFLPSIPIDTGLQQEPQPDSRKIDLDEEKKISIDNLLSTLYTLKSV